MPFFSKYLRSAAEFSKPAPPVCRYFLLREWAAEKPLLGLCMLNPSQAGAEEDDPTIASAVRLTKAAGYGGLWVINLYPFIATDPRDLIAILNASADPEESAFHFWENSKHVARVCARADRLVVAWGNTKPPLMADMVTEFIEKMPPRRLWCWGTNKDGSPRHPLYLKADTKLIPWRPK